MNNKYRQGSMFEREVKKWLEKNGYYVARSAGSKSLNDLVAICYYNLLEEVAKVTSGFPLHLYNILLIQCKVTESANIHNLLFSDEMIDFKEQKFNCDVEKYLFIKTTDEGKIYIYQNVNHGYTLIWEGNKLI